MGLFNNLV